MGVEIGGTALEKGVSEVIDMTKYGEAMYAKGIAGMAEYGEAMYAKGIAGMAEYGEAMYVKGIGDMDKYGEAVKIEAARNFIKMGILTVEQIAQGLGLSVQDVAKSLEESDQNNNL